MVAGMLIGLQIRDVVLIETLDLSIGPSLTALTGETGAGKSIILDALGLAVGARADVGLVRRGASQAVATAAFALLPDHPVWALLEEKGLAYARDEDLVLRRSLSADGRSRAFVNDQTTGVGVLREIGAALLEVHGQHEIVGLLDARTHRPMLDAFGGLAEEVGEVAGLWRAWREARKQTETLRAQSDQAAAEIEEITFRLSELDRLDPREGEEVELAEERAVLGAAEKALADIGSAQESFEGLSGRLAAAARALERARERALAAGAAAEGTAVSRLAAACEALERALIEAGEAESTIEAAAGAFEFQPDRLDKAEERLFDLRGLARKLRVSVEELPALRLRFAERLRAVESSEDVVRVAEAEQAAAREAYLAAAAQLTRARRAAGDRLAEAVMVELSPLKLEKARFQVTVEPLAEDRAGSAGLDRVVFEVSTLPGVPFGNLGAIASGGELARFALALKASLAGRAIDAQPLMIFDEVDQGVGGAVADAVGQRLKRLAAAAQVLVVTHSPQVAARAEAHWRIAKAGEGERVRAVVEVLSLANREEEIARMLAGAEVTDAARAAARALMDA